MTEKEQRGIIKEQRNIFAKRKEMEHMKKQNDFHKTVKNLMLLDPESLLLIDSGVKLLLARQNMGRKQEKEQEEDPRVQQAVI